ncbi:MAG TPA: hypothetical protein PLF40_13210, partial [Kofleriaceae bacterium]|nr:hypothetical protein [Kofleriaceae bacterium]
TATGAAAPTPKPLATVGGRAGVVVDDDAAVWGDGKAAALTYQVSKPTRVGTHVITDAPTGAVVTATAVGAGCEIAARGSAGSAFTKPLVFTLDGNCKLTADDARRPIIGGGNRAAPTPAPQGGSNTTPTNLAPPAKGARTGCCDAQRSPGSSIVLTTLVLGILGLRRRRTA